MATIRNRKIPQLLKAMASLTCLMALGSLAGCASKVFYWGPALSTCNGSASAANFAKGACRNGAEYDVARRKTRESLSEAAGGK